MPHTPGPWRIGYTGDRKRILIEGSCPDYFFNLSCAVDCDDADQETAEANARLIAAAPELLSAAEAIHECIEWQDGLQQWILCPAKGQLFIEKLNAMRTAITKAKGEQP